MNQRLGDQRRDEVAARLANHLAIEVLHNDNRHGAPTGWRQLQKASWATCFKHPNLRPVPSSGFPPRNSSFRKVRGRIANATTPATAFPARGHERRARPFVKDGAHWSEHLGPPALQPSSR